MSISLRKRIGDLKRREREREKTQAGTLSQSWRKLFLYALFSRTAGDIDNVSEGTVADLNHLI